MSVRGGRKLSKMSEIQKCLNLIQGGGGEHDSNKPEIQKKNMDYPIGFSIMKLLSKL